MSCFHRMQMSLATLENWEKMKLKFIISSYHLLVFDYHILVPPAFFFKWVSLHPVLHHTWHIGRATWRAASRSSLSCGEHH